MCSLTTTQEVHTALPRVRIKKWFVFIWQFVILFSRVFVFCFFKGGMHCCACRKANKKPRLWDRGSRRGSSLQAASIHLIARTSGFVWPREGYSAYRVELSGRLWNSRVIHICEVFRCLFSTRQLWDRGSRPNFAFASCVGFCMMNKFSYTAQGACIAVLLYEHVVSLSEYNVYYINVVYICHEAK